MISIIDLLRRFMVANKWTQRHVAEEIGMREQEMSMVMHGKRFPTAEQLVRLQRLGVASSHELLESQALWKVENRSPLLRERHKKTVRPPLVKRFS